MNNFNIQYQTIKSQIDILKLQIANIEMQYNNMNVPFQGEQLLNLAIQMFNIGLNSFNLGKSLSMSSLDNYYIQLKNISEQLLNIINAYEISNQQMQMMIMQQNPLIQAHNFNIQENYETKKMNLIFEIQSGVRTKVNIACNHGTKIKDALEIFSNKIGINKNHFQFIINGQRIDYNDNRKIEQVFAFHGLIIVLEK